MSDGFDHSDCEMTKEHSEILNGDRFYRGKDKEAALLRFKSEANESHRGSLRGARITLGHAKKAGDALRCAKKVTGGRGKWTKWLKQNFESSVETARVYMRISKYWDHPAIEKAMQEGQQPLSIKDFLTILKGGKPPNEDDETRELTDYEKQAIELIKRREAIVQEFSRELRRLSDEEFSVFGDIMVFKFRGQRERMYGEGFDQVWEATHAKITELKEANDRYRERLERIFEPTEEEERWQRMKLGVVNRMRSSKGQKNLSYNAIFGADVPPEDTGEIWTLHRSGVAYDRSDLDDDWDFPD